MSNRLLKILRWEPSIWMWQGLAMTYPWIASQIVRKPSPEVADAD